MQPRGSQHRAPRCHRADRRHLRARSRIDHKRQGCGAKLSGRSIRMTIDILQYIVIDLSTGIQRSETVVGEGDLAGCPQSLYTQYVVWLNVTQHYILCFLLTQARFGDSYLPCRCNEQRVRLWNGASLLYRARSHRVDRTTRIEEEL